MKWVWLLPFETPFCGYESWVRDLVRLRRPPHPILPSEFPCSVFLSVYLCGRQPAPGPSPAQAPRSISSKRLQTAGLVWGPTFCRPLQTTIKSPLFWTGGEKWEETDAPYTKTRFARSACKQHTERLALPPQISAWVLHWRTTWVSWHWCCLRVESKPIIVTGNPSV